MEELGPDPLWDFLPGVLGIDLTASHSRTVPGKSVTLPEAQLSLLEPADSNGTFFDGLSGMLSTEPGAY